MPNPLLLTSVKNGGITDLGHHLDLSWDFESTVDLAGSKLYDLILIDEAFDQKRNLIDHVKKNSPIGKGAPIICLSSHEDYDLTEKKKELFFRKPFTKKDVLKIIQFLENLKMNN
ncbi:MAG: hypothetical protein LEGION0403_FIIPPAGN_02356 [Legionella sp.]|uniref:Response regulatory domain-containing protein n=1 Tax=Legionella fallonii LLAP-10 TaxID=1212491 RepID=A0A098GBA6_9GAMM|nr:hypothetical protein [Legionella fallonii]CEG59255.1 conserved protein of unknown function [Legionella fallonii LLAP-10]